MSSKVKRARKLEDLNADEFMQSLFFEDGEKEVESKEEKLENLAKGHKQALLNLKEKDPDFYKFLKENDQELLNFSGTDNENEEEEEIAEDGVENTLQEELEDEEDNITTMAASIQEKKMEVTVAMIDDWASRMQGKNIFKNVSRLVSAFNAAVAMASNEESGTGKYYVKSNVVFNHLVHLCLMDLVPAWHRFLKLPEGEVKLKSLHKSKNWSKLEPVVKKYLVSLMSLTASLTEPSVIRALLKHVCAIIPFSLSFPKIVKFVLKKLTYHWSTGEESVRLLAFLCIMKVVRLDGNSWLDTIIKIMYMDYVKNCKFTSPTTWPVINFMQHSLVEVFLYNIDIGYRHAFIFIRQLAIHLRNALTATTKELVACVYSWQFIHCLFLWVRLLTSAYPNPSLDSLIYPIVQITTSTIKLIPAPKYYPLRFHCIRALIMLSRDTKVFIPVLPFILEVLKQMEFNKKMSKISLKPLNFMCMLRLSKSELKEKGFTDGVIEQVCDLLLEYLSSKSYTISFPELVLPTIKQIRTFLKTCHNSTYCRNLKEVLNKIEETVQFINNNRAHVTFKVMDSQAIDIWEIKLKQQESPLTSYCNRWKKLRDSETLLKISGKEKLEDYRLPTIERPLPLKQQPYRQHFKELLPSSDEEADAGDIFTLKNSQSEKESDVGDENEESEDEKEVSEVESEEDSKENIIERVTKGDSEPEDIIEDMEVNLTESDMDSSESS